MEPTKPSGYLALMDSLKEDALIRLIVEKVQDITLSCEDIMSDAEKIETALRQLIKRAEQVAPSQPFGEVAI